MRFLRYGDTTLTSPTGGGVGPFRRLGAGQIRPDRQLHHTPEPRMFYRSFQGKGVKKEYTRNETVARSMHPTGNYRTS